VSDYTALRQVTKLLVRRLEAAFEAQKPLSTLFSSMGYVVSPQTPAEMLTAAPQQMGVSVWLYQVDRNQFLLNQPPQRVAPDQLRRPPVSLDLHYLVTPIATDPINEQLMLGKVIQVLNDNAILPADPADPELRDEIRVTMENPGVDALSRMWTALEQAHRLSLSYLVQVVEIDSGEEPERVLPVLGRTSVYEQVMSAP
jgi:hypothetical protein